VVLRYPRRRLISLLCLPLLWLLPAIPEGVATSKSALVVQPNIDPELQWTDTLQQRTADQLTLLSDSLPAPLVIWPELPAPLYFYEDPGFRRQAQAIAARHGNFLFGTVAYAGEHEPLNTALLLGADGSVAGRYDKIDLVPFGEFVPPLFSFVNRISHETGDFVSGHNIAVLQAAGSRLGVFICYESAFPDLVRQFPARGANVLVNLSNDAYFGHSKAHDQHLLIARMRAVENRRFLIRSTNDGITAVIDPAGRIMRRLPSYEQVAAAIRFGLVETTTFYSRHGDWFAWSCLVVALGLAAREWIPGRFRRRSRNA
jgi:apolipoprotein N-acyltransferase